jgi:lysozyme
MVVKMKSLEDLLTLHEGLRLHAYDDATGKTLNRGDTLTGNLTIGIGRNLSGNGLTKREVTSLFKNDVQSARKKARRYKWFEALNEVRQSVILSLLFNMGSIDSFKKMRAAISVKNYELASIELLDSRYAEQVGDRAIVLADYLRTGSWD